MWSPHIVGLSQKTLASLALTSRRFLPFAQLNLYYRPIPPSPVTWRTGISLIESLKSTSCLPSLSSIWSPPGQLVASLEGIVDFVAEIGTLTEPKGPLSFQHPRHTEAFSLYHGILKACKRLVSVELIFDSTEHLSQLSMALESSTSTLKTVTFKNSRFSKLYRLNSGLVCSALKRDRFKGIENLICEEVEVRKSGLAGPPINIPLKTLVVVLLVTLPPLNWNRRFEKGNSFFPHDTSSLVSVSIQALKLSQTDLAWITRSLPTTLKSLTLSTIAVNVLRAPTRSSFHHQYFPSLLPDDFKRLSSLTHLSLRQFDGPSIALLESLSTSADQLVSLDFASCKWVSSSSPSQISTPSTTEIKLALDRFKKLEKINLSLIGFGNVSEWKQLSKEVSTNTGIVVLFFAVY